MYFYDMNLHTFDEWKPLSDTNEETTENIQETEEETKEELITLEKNRETTQDVIQPTVTETKELREAVVVADKAFF